MPRLQSPSSRSRTSKVASVGGGLPPGFRVFDTHAQFHAADIARYPMRDGMDPGLRAHTIAHPMTPEVLLPEWDRVGVERGCGVQVEYAYGVDNRYLLDVAERHRSRISPIVLLDPLDPASPSALTSMAKAYSASGVRFAGGPQENGEYAFLTDGALGMWETADELGLVIVLLANSLQSSKPESPALPSAMKRIGMLADRYRNVNVVLDHAGFPAFRVSPTFGFSPEHLALAGRKNVYFKHTNFVISQLDKAQVPVRDFVAYAVRVFGAEQFVWGSAVGNNSIEYLKRFPGGEVLTDPRRYRELLDLALDSAAGLSVAQKKAMFHDTAQRVFIPGGRRPRR